MTTPAPNDTTIAKVKDNLCRMQAFNDYVYNHGYAYIGNCYGLMTMQDDKDPGIGIGADLLESSFDVLGLAIGGEGGIIAADFMCSVIDDWRENTPPSLAQTFTSMLVRYEQSSRQFDSDCADYIADPVTHWNDVFTWKGSSCVLGDLATFTFPAEGDTTFYPIAASSLKALDCCIWQTVLDENCVNTEWLTNGGPTVQLSGKDDPSAWAQSFIAKNPAYYLTWQYHAKGGMFDPACWYVWEYNIGFGATKYKSNSISSAACAYLFLDSTDGHVINPNGLAARKDVFTKWGIRTATIIESTGTTPTQTEKAKLTSKA